MDWQDCLADLLILLPDLLKLPLFTGGSFISVLWSMPEMVAVYREFQKLEIDTESLLNVIQKIPVMAQAIQEAQLTGSTEAIEELFGKPKPTQT